MSYTHTEKVYSLLKVGIIFSNQIDFISLTNGIFSPNDLLGYHISSLLACFSLVSVEHSPSMRMKKLLIKYRMLHSCILLILGRPFLKKVFVFAARAHMHYKIYSVQCMLCQEFGIHNYHTSLEILRN